jgi:hypothetical protein
MRKPLRFPFVIVTRIHLLCGNPLPFDIGRESHDHGEFAHGRIYLSPLGKSMNKKLPVRFRIFLRRLTCRFA